MDTKFKVDTKVNRTNHYRQWTQPLNDLIAIALVAFLTYLAVSKLTDLETARHEMRNQVFPERTAAVMTWLLPMTELTLALLITIPRSRLAGMAGCSLLMLSFAVYVIMVLSGTFERVPCSCGGISAQVSWTGHLVISVGAFFLTLLSIVFIRKKKAAEIPSYSTRDRSNLHNF